MNTLKGLVKPPATPSRYPRTTSHRTGPPKRQSTAAPLSPPHQVPHHVHPPAGTPGPGHPPGLPPPTPGVGGRGCGPSRLDAYFDVG